MKILVLLLFAFFFLATAVAVTHAWTLDSALGGLRSMLRHPGWFLAAVLGTGGLLVPLDLFLAFGGHLVAPAALSLALMLNVAAAGGLTALHELLGTMARHVTRATTPAAEPLRLGVLGWVGPLVALVALGALIAVDPAHDGRGPGPVSSVWACYAVLSCAISAYALLRRRAGEAAGPQEG